ncbi:thiol-disulfide isomerase/thioredoxin [Methylohalomonas lacus]|uniref:Thiol-disulfide isomerase/thioredoxin n=1 Tax=Methylohalomonas lacus TaxID=398773 RepID=A0AAE3HKL2_9GAMM|nr:hypothetical protein [Methylohalomonas lacus]MCS3902943.1 thiol-disulfide isomerase/thioredoxin [Methylohalomonas lacus]
MKLRHLYVKEQYTPKPTMVKIKLSRVLALMRYILSLADTIGQDNWVLVHIWSPGCGLCVRETADVIHFHQRHPNIPMIAMITPTDELVASWPWPINAGKITTFINSITTIPCTTSSPRGSEPVAP